MYVSIDRLLIYIVNAHSPWPLFKIPAYLLSCIFKDCMLDPHSFSSVHPKILYHTRIISSPTFHSLCCVVRKATHINLFLCSFLDDVGVQ